MATSAAQDYQNKKSSTPKETNNLMTGASYLESLNDGREIWFDGEKVANVEKVTQGD